MSTAYTIVSGFAEDLVSDNINTLLDCGWKLHGGLQVSAISGGEYHEDQVIYAQAMVKEYPDD